MKKINVAIVGLSFGGSFVPIYRDHPDVGKVGLCDLDSGLMNRFGELYGIRDHYGSLEEVLADDTMDAVHLVTPIPQHARQIIQVLRSGRDCACTVPMAVSHEEVRQIMDAIRESGRKFMLMETTLYTYQMFYVRQMLEKGEMGKIQFMRGCHYQDMSGWPSYWEGLPPFWYGTHALSPLLALSGGRVERVFAYGSGTMSRELTEKYGNPYPVETALLEFTGGLKGEVTRSLFETAHVYKEGFCVYGSKKSFEWGFYDGSKPYVTTLEELADIELNPDMKGVRGRATPSGEVDVPNYYLDLPEEIRKYTVGKNYDATNPQNSLKKGAGAGHHGSHPHLVNEFVRAIVENREPAIGRKLACEITETCLCIHDSAMAGGVCMEVRESFGSRGSGIKSKEKI